EAWWWSMPAQWGVLRERTRRAADSCFGHRLMMDRVVPGGVACDLGAGGMAAVNTLLAEVRRVFPRLVGLYDNTASLQDRTAQTGILRPDYARQFGAGGYVGRASGRTFDARKAPRYPPSGALPFEVPTRAPGDGNGRVGIRMEEVEQSLALIEQVTRRLPEGAIKADVKGAGDIREGLGLAEAFRGDVLAWVRLDGERITRCHLRDPSWFQW